jgi:hypothetical protein
VAPPCHVPIGTVLPPFGSGRVSRRCSRRCSCHRPVLVRFLIRHSADVRQKARATARGRHARHGPLFCPGQGRRHNNNASDPVLLPVRFDSIVALRGLRCFGIKWAYIYCQNSLSQTQHPNCSKQLTLVEEKFFLGNCKISPKYLRSAVLM